MNNERRLNMSEEEARKRIRELLSLPKEDLLTQHLFLQQENQELKKQLQNISNEFLKYDWKIATQEQIYNQLKSLYESIFETKE